MIFYWGGDELGIVSCTRIITWGYTSDPCDWSIIYHVPVPWILWAPWILVEPNPDFHWRPATDRVTSSQVIGTIHISSWNRTIPSEIEFQVPKMQKKTSLKTQAIVDVSVK